MAFTREYFNKPYFTLYTANTETYRKYESITLFRNQATGFFRKKLTMLK